jgi:hypothetical protein
MMKPKSTDILKLPKPIFKKQIKYMLSDVLEKDLMYELNLIIAKNRGITYEAAAPKKSVRLKEYVALCKLFHYPRGYERPDESLIA